MRVRGPTFASPYASMMMATKHDMSTMKTSTTKVQKSNGPRKAFSSKRLSKSTVPSSTLPQQRSSAQHEYEKRSGRVERARVRGGRRDGHSRLVAVHVMSVYTVFSTVANSLTVEPNAM